MSEFAGILRRSLTPLALAGWAAALLSLGVALVDVRQAMTGWLIGATFWIGVPVGALAWVMIHHLTRGRWGLLVRPSMEAASVTLPLAALLALPPIILGGAVFPWANHAMVAADETLRHQQAYMAPWLVWLRLLIYVAVGTALAFTFWKARRPMQHLAAPGLIALMLLGSLASVDFLMTRTADYVSSVFGFVVVVGWAYSAWALVLLARGGDPAIRPERRGELGSLLATCALLWAYLSFMQLLISWEGNKSNEAHWYVLRGLSGEYPNPWRWAGLALFLLAFAAPFGAMLFRSIKRDARKLPVVAGVALAGRLLDVTWLAAPSDVAGGFGVWTVLVAALVLGGFGLAWWPLWAALRAATPAVPPTVAEAILQRGEGGEHVAPQG